MLARYQRLNSAGIKTICCLDQGVIAEIAESLLSTEFIVDAVELLMTPESH